MYILSLQLLCAFVSLTLRSPFFPSLYQNCYSYKELGLNSEPNKSDNGVHGSASPFEGLAEKINWLERDVADYAFGQALLDSGITLETIEEWSVDPRLKLSEGEFGSIFDALEDMDAGECLSKLIQLNELNTDTASTA